MATLAKARSGKPPIPSRVPNRESHPPEGNDVPPFKGFLSLVTKARSQDRHTALSAQQELSRAYQSEYQTCSLSPVTKTAMGETSGSIGGYLVPMEYTNKLLTTLAEESFFFSRANIIPMHSAQIMAPAINVETAPSAAGIPPFFGGVQFTWGFSQAPVETEPTFRQKQLTAWDLLGFCNASNQLVMDTGPEGEEYLIDLFGKAAAWYAEYAMFQGTGTAQQMPLGVLSANNPSLITVSRQAVNQISAIDIAAVAAKMLPRSWRYAFWACSPTALAQIVALNTYQVNNGNEYPGAAGTLVTRPLFVTEKLPTLGTKGDLMFIDPSLYTVGMRQEVLVDVSDQQLFRTYQTQYRIWMRLGGFPQLSSTITLQDTTTVVSAYVALN